MRRRRRPTTLPTSGWARRGDDENAPKCHKNGKGKRKPRRRTSSIIALSKTVRYAIIFSPHPNSPFPHVEILDSGGKKSGRRRWRRKNKKTVQPNVQAKTHAPPISVFLKRPSHYSPSLYKRKKAFLPRIPPIPHPISEKAEMHPIHMETNTEEKATKRRRQN